MEKYTELQSINHDTSNIVECIDGILRNWGDVLKLKAINYYILLDQFITWCIAILYEFFLKLNLI